MSIRLATVQDVPTLFWIRTSVVENHQSLAQLAEYGITPTSVAIMLQTDARAWLAEIHGEGVGFTMVDGNAGYIFGMFVLPLFEGRGIGRALLTRAEDWLFHQRRFDCIQLHTDADTTYRAWGFYHQLGWECLGQETMGPFAGEMKLVKYRPPALLVDGFPSAQS